MSIWYHHTTPERVREILNLGLRPGSHFNKTHETSAFTIKYTYGDKNPIFLSKNDKFKEPGDITLAVEINDDYLLPDFPSLIDTGANINEYGESIVIWWENWPSSLDLSDEDREYGIDITDESYYKDLIDITGTAATLHNILPSNIKIMKENKIILEFGRADFNTVISNSENFTIAYEIELEEIPEEQDKYGFSKDIDYRYEQMYAALESGEFDEDEIEDLYDLFKDKDEQDYENYDDEYSSHGDFNFDNLSLGNDPDMNREEDYFPFTEDEIMSEFPKFFRKWGELISIKPDITLDKGFEVIPKTYFTSIQESFNFVDDFFSDYYHQDRFELNANTGWHINIGFAGENLKNLNLFKGAILLSDEFATKDFAHRLRSEYAKPIRNHVLKAVQYHYDYEVDGESLMKKIFSKNLEKIEKVGSEFLLTTGATKEFGFNPRGKYVEFRYPGGKLTPTQIKEATLYYCYIIKAIVDPSFKRKEYIKKLYKLLFGGDNQ